MQFRRRWNSIVCASIFAAAMSGMAGTALAQKAAPLIVAEDAAKQFLTAKGPDAVKLKDTILKGATDNLDTIKKNSYAVELGKAFDKAGLFKSDANTDGAVNAMMTLVELDVLNSDTVLRAQLSNSNPAIRYWAAKGLFNIMPRLKELPATLKKVLAELEAQLKVETSGVVKQQILRAIAAGDSTADTSAAVMTVAKSMETTIPDIGSIVAVSVGVESVATAVKGGATLSAAEKADILTATALAMSYVAQQNNALADKNVLPEGQNAAAIVLVRRGIDLINAVAGKKIAEPSVISDKDSPTDLIVDVFAIVGSPTVPGALQGTFPAITAPGVVKPGA